MREVDLDTTQRMDYRPVAMRPNSSEFHLPGVGTLRTQIEDMVCEYGRTVTLSYRRKGGLWVAAIGDQMCGSAVGPSDALKQLAGMVEVEGVSPADTREIACVEEEMEQRGKVGALTAVVLAVVFTLIGYLISKWIGMAA